MSDIFEEMYKEDTSKKCMFPDYKCIDRTPAGRCHAIGNRCKPLIEGKVNLFDGLLKLKKQKKEDIGMNCKEIQRRIDLLGESLIETCKRQRGGFDFLED